MSVTISERLFTEFCNATGQPAYTIVRNEWLKQHGRTPKAKGNFWKPFKDQLPVLLAKENPAIALKEFVESDAVKDDQVALYSTAVDSLARWIGRSEIRVGPRTRMQHWRYGELDVRVRPELALWIDGVPYVVKLWFDSARKRGIDKKFANPLLAMLDETHGKGAKKSAKPAVLDVVHGKFFKPTAPVRGMTSILHAEAMRFMQMWDELAAAEA